MGAQTPRIDSQAQTPIIDSQTQTLADQRVPLKKSVGPCLMTDEELELQKQLAFLEQQHATAMKALKQGAAQSSSFQQQHESLATELSQEAGRLDRSIRDLSPVVRMVQGDLASLRLEVREKIAKLHAQCQIFSDRLILLEMDMSAARSQPSPSSDGSSSMQQPQQGQNRPSGASPADLIWGRRHSSPRGSTCQEQKLQEGSTCQEQKRQQWPLQHQEQEQLKQELPRPQPHLQQQEQLQLQSPLQSTRYTDSTQEGRPVHLTARTAAAAITSAVYEIH